MLPTDLQGVTCVRRIAGGAFSEVFEAKYDATNETVAVKVISKQSLDWNPRTSENLRREIEIMKNLQHPNGIYELNRVVLNLIDLIQSERSIALVLE